MVSYKEEIIRDQCVFGLRNKGTQANILALGKGLPTLEAVITKAEAEEQAKMAQDKLTKGIKHEDLADVSAVEVDKAKLGDPKKKCKYCGRTGQGRDPNEQTRKDLCKAYGKTCYKCEGSGHFANVCTGKKENAKSNAVAVVQEEEESTAVFSSLQMREEVSRVGNLDWDKELNHLVRRKPKGMAEMRVDIRVLVEDQKHWHPDKRVHKYWEDVKNKSGKVSHMKCVPDTGAMVTCAGPALLNKLNMAQSTLIPTSQSILMANNKSMHIMGAVMVEIRAEKEGRRKYTRQFCYICKEVTGLYLSLSACEDLDGVLPWNKVNSPLGVNGIKQVEGDRRSSYHGKPGHGLPLSQVRSKPPSLPDNFLTFPKYML